MIDIDLKPFCSTEEYRSYLCQPFSLGDWTYASNGHIGIRVPRRADVPENDKAPASIEDLFANAGKFAFHALDVSNLGEERKIKCTTCRGLGYGEKCKRCNGEGHHDCDCEHCVENCIDCDGDGLTFAGKDVAPEKRMSCGECDGTGFDLDERVAVFPNQLAMKVRYLRMVLSLPGPVEMAARMDFEKSESSGDIHHAAQVFIGPGWTALIMPLRWSQTAKADVVIDWAGLKQTA